MRSHCDLDSTHPTGAVFPTGLVRAPDPLMFFWRSAISTEESSKYFDLYTTGIGYLNRFGK
jgi:hypothetical protein